MPLSPLLAFGFASPWLLLGLTAAGAPIIIHLLNRRKFRETSWAAMKFLLAAVRKNQRRLQVQQWLLLAVRTLLVLLVVLALSRPFVEELGAYFQAGQPTHKIVVIDATLSMGYHAGEKTLIDRTTGIAREIVEDSRQGDATNLVRISSLPPTIIVPTPSYQPSDVTAEVDQLQLPHARGDLLAVLRKTADLLPAAPQLKRKEVYFLTDLQRATWGVGTPDELSELRAAFRKLSESARLTFIDVGQNGAENVAVTDFRMQDPFVMISRPARFTITLRNFGSQVATGKTLDLLVDGRVVQQKRMSIPAGAEVTENFSHAFTTGGEHPVQARVTGDALPLDDQRWLAVPVKEQIQVLCVSGKNTGRPMGKATDFLELALAPPSLSAGPRLVNPRIISEGELLATDLSRYDCVFLCNVRMFTPRESEVLEAYLKGGGGVVWCLGDQVLPDSYNSVLYREGKGILPARLGERKGNPENREANAAGADTSRNRGFEFDAGEFSHPIVQAFRGNPDAGLQTTRTYAYQLTNLDPSSSARVVLKYDSGDAAILEKSVGRGKSLLITTSVDDQWGNWAVWPSFLPLLQETVLFAVSGRWGERQHLVGEPIGQSFPVTASDVEVAIRRPDGRTFPLTVTRSGSIGEFSFDETTVSGLYEVTFAHPISRTELHAVNIDPRESDLTKYVKDELEGELLKGIDFHYETEWAGRKSDAAPAAPQEHGGLSRWLLYLVLYLLLVEQMLSWNFRYGLWMLCPPLAVLPTINRLRGRPVV